MAGFKRKFYVVRFVGLNKEDILNVVDTFSNYAKVRSRRFDVVDDANIAKDEFIIEASTRSLKSILKELKKQSIAFDEIKVAEEKTIYAVA